MLETSIINAVRQMLTMPMIMAYLTVAFIIIPWIVLGLYIRWAVQSGYEESFPLSEET